MPLRQRIICKLLFEDGTLVKYRQFTRDKRIVGNPKSTLAVLTDQRLDEFCLTFLGDVDCELVRSITGSVFTPVSVAGGVRSRRVVDTLIRECCVDRVITRCHATGEYIAGHYGVQAAVWPVTYTGECGIRRYVPPWAGEVLLASIDRDGMMHGMDISALGLDWPVPVTLSGGVGKLVHVKEAFEAGASGVAVASMFAFSDKSPIKLRSWLVSEGANVRAA